MLNSPLRALSLAALLLLAGSDSSAAPRWRFSNPAPHGNNILDLALHNDAVWQIGDRGQLYTSTDLDTWLPRETGTSRSLRSIVFFNGAGFIAAEAGLILRADSPDHFTPVELGIPDWLEGIAASPGILVAVGDNGAIYSSTNGAAWTRRGSFTAWLRSVAWGRNLFVAAGEDGFLATSPDGANWTRRSLNTSAHLNEVAFINDRFWVAGDAGTLFATNPQMEFTRVNTGVTNTLFAIAGNTNELVLAGDGLVLLGNAQGTGWTRQSDEATPALAPVWPYYSALWDGRLFLLGGRTGMKVEGFRTNAASPILWYSETQPTREWLWSATRATNFYAACGTQGTIVTSDDGIEWTREYVPAAAAGEVLLGIGGNNQALIAVGTGGIILRAPNITTNQTGTNATSLFGVIWEQSPSPTSNDLQAVAASDNLFLIGGARGALFTSASGANWQPRVSGVTNFFSSATASPLGWFVTGSAGAIRASTDAAAWQPRASGVTEWVYSVRYAGGKLIAVGENGLILTSENGTLWTRRNSGVTEWLNDATFAQNAWYVAGSSGLVLTSPDAVNWSASRSATSKSLYAAVTDGQQLILAGMEGVILRSQLAPVTSPVNFFAVGAAGGETLFLFTGVADQRFELQNKPRLEDAWSPGELLELVGSGGTLLYERPAGAGRSTFFRTRLLAP